MRSIFTSLLILFILFAFTMQAQEPLLRHFTIKDGLPGGMVYMCMQDSKGYLWSATERGVTRFDGHEFKLFSIKDGLPDNDVWKLVEDNAGRIWVNTFSGICYIEDDQVVEYKSASFPERIEKVQHHFCELGHLILLPNSDQIYLLNEQDSIVFDSNLEWSLGSVLYHKGLTLRENRASSIFKKFRENLKVEPENQLILYNQTIFIDRNEAIEQEHPNFHKEIQKISTISQGKVIFLKKGKLWLMTKNSLQLLDLNYLVEKNELPKINNFYNVGENRFKIETNDHTIIVDTLLNPIINLNFLKNYTVNHLLFDRQNNLWVSSSHGLFFLNKEGQQTSTYNLKGDKKESIKYLSLNNQGEVWGLSTAGNLYRFEEEKGFQKLGSNPLVVGPTDLAFDHQGNLFVGGSEGVFKISRDVLLKGLMNNEFPEKLNAFNLKTNSALKRFQTNEGRVLMAMHDYIYALNSRSFELRKNKFSDRFYGLAIKKNGDYWASGKNGVKLFSKNDIDLEFEKTNEQPLFNSPIDNILVDNHDHLWLAANNKDVYQFDGNKLNRISELNGILVSSFYIDKKEQIWISTNQGIAKISNIEEAPFSYKFKWLTEFDGLASNNVSEVVVHRNKIYAATENGLSILQDIERDTINELPPFNFSSLKINGEDTAIQPFYNLKFRENTLQINYDCLDYKNMGTIRFQYKLEGVDQNWNETDEFHKEYSLLPPGDYTFRLRRKQGQEVLKQEVLSMKFKINPPIWKEKWFVFGGLAALGFLCYLLFRNQMNKIKKRAEEEHTKNLKFAELELSALQAQLNPHFVSNVLQAIQELVFKKDERLANRYLVKFSRLMRLFLESSKEKFILLQDELQLLKLYIELEQLRFKDKFTFQIEISKELEFSMIKIPTMLLQPFIENAINHGLYHRESSGKLLLIFSQIDNHLNCRIEDNGIGRERALKIKKNSIKSYRSRGMQLVEERKEAWNLVGNAPMDIIIEDLYDAKGQPSGTRVDVIISIDN